MLIKGYKAHRNVVAEYVANTKIVDESTEFFTMNSRN